MLQGTHILTMIFMCAYTVKTKNMHLQHRMCACNSYFVPPSLPNLGVQSVKSGVQFHLLNGTKTASSGPYTALCPVDRGNFAYFNASYRVLNSFFVMSSWKFHSFFWFDMLTGQILIFQSHHIKKLRELACEITHKKIAYGVHFQLLTFVVFVHERLNL